MAESSSVNMYRIEANTSDLEKVPEDKMGQFYPGDSYAIFLNYTSPSDEKCVMAYVWHGLQSGLKTEDDAVERALSTCSLGKPSAIIICNQGYEPPPLRSIFRAAGAAMIVHASGALSGTAASRTDKSKPHSANKTLYRVICTAPDGSDAYGMAVPSSPSSINGTECFVLPADGLGLLWIGSDSPEDIREAASVVAGIILGDPSAVLKMAEGQEMDEFWSCLGGKDAYPREPPTPVSTTAESKLLSRVGEDKYENAPLAQSTSLVDDAVVVLDRTEIGWTWVCVWAGLTTPESSSAAAALAVSREYCESLEQYDRTIARVEPGKEIVSFTSAFPDWTAADAKPPDANGSAEESKEEAANELEEEDAARQKAEEEAVAAAEEARKKAEEEAAAAEAQKKADEEAAAAAAAEEEKKKAEEEAAAQAAAEEEARKKAEEEAAAAAAAEEEKKKAEEEAAATAAAEEEARRKAEEEAAAAAAEEEKKKAEEEAAAAAAAEEEAAAAAAEDEKKKAEEEAAQKKAEEEAAAAAEEEARKKAEEAAVAAAAEEEARKKAEAEAAAAAAEEESRKKAEEEAAAAAEEKKKAEEEEAARKKAEEEAAAAAEEEARKKAEEEAAAAAEEKARKKAEEEEEARKKEEEEEEARLREIEEAALAEEAKKKAEEEAAAKKKAEKEAAAKKKGEEEAAKKKAEKEAADKKKPGAQNPSGSGDDFYSIDQLKDPIDGVDWSNRERYLSDVDFQETFKMDKGKFKTLPKWRQNSMKKGVGLF